MSNGAKLRKLREAHQWGLRPLARELAVDVAYLSRIENDKATASDEVLCGIARVLGEDENVVFAYAGKLSPALQEIILQHPKEFAALVHGLKDASSETILSVAREVRDGKW